MVDDEGSRGQGVDRRRAQEQPSRERGRDDYPVVGRTKAGGKPLAGKKEHAPFGAIHTGTRERSREDDARVEEVVVVLEIGGVLVIVGGVENAILPSDCCSPAS